MRTLKLVMPRIWSLNRMHISFINCTAAYKVLLSLAARCYILNALNESIIGRRCVRTLPLITFRTEARSLRRPYDRTMFQMQITSRYAVTSPPVPFRLVSMQRNYTVVRARRLSPVRPRLHATQLCRASSPPPLPRTCLVINDLSFCE